MDFSGQDNPAFKGTKVGRIYLTTHRMIFNNNKQSDALLSFSFPFVTLSDVSYTYVTCKILNRFSFKRFGFIMSYFAKTLLICKKYINTNKT